MCYNGQDAIDIIQEKTFDLVLLDLRLPDIYGTDVLAGIKEINAKIPVIIVTAHGTEKDRQLCIQLGAYAFMHKPLNIEELTPILKKLRELSE
ncbi:MAG: response regulator [Deltaproteobacteria bacterium]|nr:response regulator [Deltaproteobacteria bacterium]